MVDKYDKWEDTEAALAAASKLLILLHNESNTSNKAKIEVELKEVRKWCVELHNRRIAINIRKEK